MGTIANSPPGGARSTYDFDQPSIRHSREGAKSSGPGKQEQRGSGRTMARRTIQDIFKLIAQFQAQHGQRFPTIVSPCIRTGHSWNAIDSALRRDAIVQCPQFVELKAALLRRGLTPSLARLNAAHVAVRTQKRRFADILAMVRHSVELHGQFPMRTSKFDVPGYRDTWTAIDSALIDGAIAECPLWTAHCGKMRQLGISASLASLHPAYRPLRRQHRSIASIIALVVEYMVENAGKMPNQRARFPGTKPHDTWKAICKALRSSAVIEDADKREFDARLAQSNQKPSLYTLMECYRSALQSAYDVACSRPAGAMGQPPSQSTPEAAPVTKQAVPFAALISQLFS